MSIAVVRVAIGAALKALIFAHPASWPLARSILTFPGHVPNQSAHAPTQQIVIYAIPRSHNCNACSRDCSTPQRHSRLPSVLQSPSVVAPD